MANQKETPPAGARDAVTDGEKFADWLAREMPAGTVISNPHWWARKIIRALPSLTGKADGSTIDRPARVGGRDFKTGALVQQVVGRAHAEYDRHQTSTKKEDGRGSDHLRRLVGKLAQWQLRMSYNDSYFGEPAGMVKQVVAELARAVDPIYPPMPEPVDPLAGVTIYTATVPKATQPAATGAVRSLSPNLMDAVDMLDQRQHPAFGETNTAAPGMGEVRKARALIDHFIHGEVANDALTEAHDLLTAALAAQPALAGEVTVVQDDHGNVVAVTRTDSEHRVLSVIWEREQPAPVVGGNLVPGVMRCAKCKFQLIRNTLYLGSGIIGAGTSETEPCPNGCGPLWPVTWEEYAKEGWEQAERFHGELQAALSTRPAESVAQGGGDDRLLAALERAGKAESALRRLVDECENDTVPGWEDRMAACILAANTTLSPATSPTPATGSGGEAVAYLAENGQEAFVFFANDHESLDAYTADGFSISSLGVINTQAAEPPSTNMRRPPFLPIAHPAPAGGDAEGGGPP